MKRITDLISRFDKEPSVRQQCQLLDVHRNTLYYQPKEEKRENLEMMRIIDKHLLSRPTERIISMVYLLGSLGFILGQKGLQDFFG